MTLIQAKIHSVGFQLSKKDQSEGISIICSHDDGSEWGKKIYKWLWWYGGSTDNNLIKWARLAVPDCKEEEAREVIGSHQLCGLEIDLIVDDSANMWKILEVGLVGTFTDTEKTTSGIIDDDIPF